MFKKLSDLIQAREGKNVLFLAVLAILVGLQLLTAAAFVLNLSPQDTKAVLDQYFPAAQPGVRPEQEITIYRFFIVAAVLVFIVLIFVLRRPGPEGGIAEKAARLLPMEIVLTAGLIAAGQAWVLNPQAVWLRSAFYIFAVMAVVFKLFWGNDIAVERFVNPILGRLRNILILPWVADIAFLMFISAVIFVTDIEAVTAVTYYQDHFAHLDGFVMAPGWAYLNGLIVNVDILNQYGVFCVAAISRLAQLLGGFSYEHVITIEMIAALLYFILSYLFLRSWLRNSVLAAAGIILAVKWQMFNPGAEPIIWRFPASTVVRYFFDIIFFILILQHIRREKEIFLWLAAIVSGVALAYVTDTGMYLVGTLLVYMLMAFLGSASVREIFRQKARLAVFAGCAALSIAVAAAILWLVVGRWIFSAVFWDNATENIWLFLTGYNNMPIYSNLGDGDLGAYLFGLIIPLTYVFTLLGISYFYLSRQLAREHLLAVLLSVYGLGLYHYYVCRSAPTSFQVVCLPFVFLLCYWGGALIERMEAISRKVLVAGLFLFTVVFLLGDPMYQKYPNIFHRDPDMWAEQRAAYEKEFNFSRDEDLIRELIAPGGRVALVSSFETAFLIGAGRPPFFYYSPMINSERLDTRGFRDMQLWTKERLAKTLQQLEEHPPEYVFVERKLYEGQLPMPYYVYHEALTALMQYLSQNYEPYKSGQYLSALKHKTF